MVRSIQELTAEAESVQDACNLSGVVHAFAEVLDALWEHARAQGEGTAWVNQHPITRAFVSKLASLSGLGVEAGASVPPEPPTPTTVIRVNMWDNAHNWQVNTDDIPGLFEIADLDERLDRLLSVAGETPAKHEYLLYLSGTDDQESWDEFEAQWKMDRDFAQGS